MTDAPSRPLIGVMGGLGPAASADLYAKVVAATRAATDQQHVRLLIDGDPEVPDRNASIAGSGPSSAPALVAKARRLAAAGADVLVMACNAAHVYLPAIRAAVDLPFVSIVDETAAATLERVGAGATVGVLAAPGAQAAQLYPNALTTRGLGALEPTGAEAARFTELLYRIKAGGAGDPAVRLAMADLAGGLVTRGAAAVIAGCTEVPLVLDEQQLTVPLIASTEALVAAIVAIGTGSRPSPGRQ